MAKKQFKAESKRLMDLMIHSIYTNKEIFLRELISNASDAMDKLAYRALTDSKIKLDKELLTIDLELDEENRCFTIKDHGCGMTKEELESNLGTIAESDSFKFKKEHEKKDDIDIIGQFGVGFYSAFMVSDKISVITKAYNSDTAYLWESTGSDGYTITETEKQDYGTDIILHIKADCEEETYSDYLKPYFIERLVKKYSDYITYPIRMEVEISKEEKVEKEMKTLNSLVPLWKRDKKEITEEEYHTFYSDKFFDYETPLCTIHTNAEGTISFQSLLYIPSHAPYNYYSKEYEKGLQLYSNGVLIIEKCKELIPDYFSFVKGIVDSSDLSLNISREMLQQDQVLKKIAKTIEGKIKKELETLLKKDREKYEEFYKAFGMQLKFGIYNDYGMHKDLLQDLLLFYSSKQKKMVSFKEYVEQMKENQDSIYYACGETIDKIDLLPQVEKLKEKELEVLYFTDYVDEFVVQVLMEYDHKKFQNVASSEFDIATDEEKEHLKSLNDEHIDLLNAIKEALPEIKEIRLTTQLKQHPVCLVSEGNVTIEMEKVINAMPTDEQVKATLIMEINANHPIVAKLKELQKQDAEQLKNYSKILYAQARLIEGLPIENPTELSNLICNALS